MGNGLERLSGKWLPTAPEFKELCLSNPEPELKTFDKNYLLPKSSPEARREAKTKAMAEINELLGD
jgi:hypothetical protein